MYSGVTNIQTPHLNDFWEPQLKVGEFESNVVNLNLSLFTDMVLVPDLENLQARCYVKLLWMLKFIIKTRKARKQSLQCTLFI